MRNRFLKKKTENPPHCHVPLTMQLLNEIHANLNFFYKANFAYNTVQHLESTSLTLIFFSSIILNTSNTAELLHFIIFA